MISMGYFLSFVAYSTNIRIILYIVISFSDSASFLEKNYCRRAGDGVAPWCYTDAELCLRDYCDVCDLGL
jgi:hypothetical protein